MPWWIRKTIAWVLLGSPAFYAAYLIAINDLGANPLETLTDHTGQWTLRFLLLGLLITPLRQLTDWVSLIRYRRLIGLFASRDETLMFNGYSDEVADLYRGMDLAKFY